MIAVASRGASACFLGREPEGRDEVRCMLDDVCGVVENSVLGISRIGADVSCHVGCSTSPCLGFLKVVA